MTDETGAQLLSGPELPEACGVIRAARQGECAIGMDQIQAAVIPASIGDPG